MSERWAAILRGEHPLRFAQRAGRRAFALAPASKRCKLCNAPFTGVSAVAFRLCGYGQSPTVSTVTRKGQNQNKDLGMSRGHQRLRQRQLASPRDRGSSAPKPRLRAAADRAAAVERRLVVDVDRIPAARARGHGLAGEGRHRRRSRGACPGRSSRCPPGLAADRWSRRRLMIAADAVRVLAIGSACRAILLDRVAFWEIVVVAFVEGMRLRPLPRAQPGALRAVVPTHQLPAAAATETGAAGSGAARGPTARRRALRDRPRAPVRRRRDLVRVLDHLAARDADTVPGGTRAARRVAALAARRGLPLRLGPAVPANVRAALRARELHRPRRAVRRGRDRQATRDCRAARSERSSRPSAPACCSARCCRRSCAGCLPVRGRPAARALDVARLRASSSSGRTSTC